MTDPLISEYLPVLRGHVIKKYRWMEERGNCLITIDDLIQIASIRLLKLAADWDDILAGQGKTRAGNNGLFWKYLENGTKQSVLKYYERVGNVPLKGKSERDVTGGLTAISADGEEYGATDDQSAREWWQSVEDSMFGKITLRKVADFFDTLPRRDKIIIALRHYDELPFAQIDALLGVAKRTVNPQADQIVTRWRDFARNQFTDHQVEVSKRQARPWEPTDVLIEYLRTRHRNDLPTYLGRVTIAFHTDPTYLAEILNPATTRSPASLSGYHGDRLPLSAFMQAQIDKMLGEGVTGAEIARTLGLSRNRVYDHAKRRHAA
ncbi:sigma-70 family RNA polymerase sigma factor [Microbacterium paludicola]|uniref:sigma-70 family RNA polymerase sigma factor n=1 Tax=Microbacterium paludicola TaxID=300019 RepID=UPI0011A59A54|nr:sigma-70 family RNA polymerase sigma factor [Microbacterium paludicola]